jgi:hypothetical protein
VRHPRAWTPLDQETERIRSEHAAREDWLCGAPVARITVIRSRVLTCLAGKMIVDPNH